MLKKWLILICVLFVGGVLQDSIAQESPLDITLSISEDQKSVEYILKSLESDYDFTFSYNSKLVQVDREVTINESSITVRALLNELFENQVDLIVVEKQIVISPKKKEVPEEEIKNITLNGVIKDSESGELMIGATIWIPELSQGVASNLYGFYSISIPPGDYNLQLSYIGYEKKSIPISLNSDTNLQIELSKSPSFLEEITITAKEFTVKENIEQKGVNLQSQFVSEIPALMSEPDVLKAVQMVPGVNFQSDVSTFYFVRGGDRGQNIILLDEAPVYNPSHMLGLFSTVSPETVKGLKLYKGDAPLSLGGFTSSYLAIQTNDGNKKHLKFTGDLGLVAARLAFEGPLKKDKSSFFIAGRTSHVKWFFQQQNPAIEDFYFYDLTGKLNIEINKKHRIFFTIYGGKDFYQEDKSNNIQWTNTAATLRWNYLISSKWFANTTFTASAYDYLLSTQEDARAFWNSRISDAGLKFDVTHFRNPSNTWNMGLGLKGYQFNPGNLVDRDGENIGTFISKKFANEFTLYAENDIMPWPKLNLVYGLRLFSWTNVGEAFEVEFNENRIPVDTTNYKAGEAYNNYTTLEPRIRLSYSINDEISINTGYRKNTQNIHLISNSISPFTNQDVWLPSNVNIPPQISHHAFLGMGWLLKNSVLFTTELYYKLTNNSIGYRPHSKMIFNPFLERELFFGKARSYGIEFTLLKEVGRFRGLGGYVFSRAKERYDELNGGNPFPSFQDAPHQLKFNLQYNITERIMIAGNFTYHTGFAISIPTNFYVYDEQQIPYYSSINNDRLPDYHRLDLAGRFVLNKSNDKKFTHYLEVNFFNLYGRKNPYYINFNKIELEDKSVIVPGNLLDKSLVPTHTYVFQFVPSVSYHFTLNGK